MNGPQPFRERPQSWREPHVAAQTPDRPADRSTAPSPGPWLCATGSFDWDQRRDIAACKLLCARCTTRGDCADLWLSGTPAEQRYGVGVWAGFDMSDRTDRRTFHRWAGLT